MKTLGKSKWLALLFFGALAFSCKNNEAAPEDAYGNEIDSTEMAIDSVSPLSDTVYDPGTGTTGATGQGSTGSGSAGTTEMGNSGTGADSVPGR
jgi:hypothetical protein